MQSEQGRPPSIELATSKWQDVVAADKCERKFAPSGAGGLGIVGLLRGRLIAFGFALLDDPSPLFFLPFVVHILLVQSPAHPLTRVEKEPKHRRSW